MAYISFQPQDYFNTLLYTGNNTASTTISGVGFESDFTWIKSRTTTEHQHAFDAVRGGGNRLYPNLTNAQSYISTTLTSWTSDGFVTGTDNGTNANGENFVAWNWKANGAGVSNTDGNLTSTVSANTTAGFSIVKYTSDGSGTTIGHGLGVEPDVILLKNTSQAENWVGNFSAIHSASGNGNNLYLNLTNANGSDIQTVTARNSTTFTCANFGNPANSSSAYNYVAYCFAEKKGFSKFGSYTGNGSLDAPFLYCGFKPAWLIIKKTNSTGNWIMMDNKRNPFNEMQKHIAGNTNEVEDSSTSYNDFDFLSNGVKIREDNGDINASGSTYIYMAFAEAPLVSSNGVPATAR